MSGEADYRVTNWGLTRGKIKYAWWTPDRNKQCKSTLLTTQTWRPAAVSPQCNRRKLKTNTIWKIQRYCCSSHKTHRSHPLGPLLCCLNSAPTAPIHPARWSWSAEGKFKKQRTELWVSPAICLCWCTVSPSLPGTCLHLEPCTKGNDKI